MVKPYLWRQRLYASLNMEKLRWCQTRTFTYTYSVHSIGWDSAHICLGIFIAVKRNHVQGNSYNVQHWIGSLTISEVQPSEIIITAGAWWYTGSRGGGADSATSCSHQDVNWHPIFSIFLKYLFKLHWSKQKSKISNHSF